MNIQEQTDFVADICEKCRHYDDKDDSFCINCTKVDKAMKKKNQLTHKELVDIGASLIYELYAFGAHVVGGHEWHILTETGLRRENPDVFAFTKHQSILIECKASRSDFLADKKKPFRQNPQDGIGAMRFYLVNEGVARHEEMPDKWQLIEALDSHTVRVQRDFSADNDSLKFNVRNASAEIELMYSWLYRKQHNCLPNFAYRQVSVVF